ncbi:aspartate--tRNA ligase, mitochondrial [Ciona intestinalis]
MLKSFKFVRPILFKFRPKFNPATLCIVTKQFTSNSAIPQVVQSRKNEKLPNSKFSYRSHTCGELGIKNVGETVSLCGWLEYKRKNFLLLRDSFGSVQILITGYEDKNQTFQNVKPESVMKVTGKVTTRPKGQANPNMVTGEIEIIPDNVEILNKCKFLPFRVQKFAGKGERIRQKYRYLDIRGDILQQNLRLRSKVLSMMRKSLEENCFVEVETPTLFHPTPGGAREFIVPSSSNPGKFYSLPQSPQQLKQLLMIGGVDRYYQFARCYRDEPFKTDRQAEFTQLDIEMSFVDVNDVIKLSEKVIKSSWPRKFSDESFKLITYDDAMSKYGSDKPDTRFGMLLHDVTTLIPDTLVEMFQGDRSNPVNIQAMVVENAQKHFSSKFRRYIGSRMTSAIDDPSPYALLSHVNGQWSGYHKNTNIGSMVTNQLVDHLQLGGSDVVVVSWGEKRSAQKTMGALRRIISRMFDEISVKHRNVDLDQFLWVVDFPLFEADPDTGGLCTVHHPFTSPHPDDVHLLEDDPLKVRSQAYDLVLNGNEVGGGSIRIHDSKLQRQIFKLLNLDFTELSYLLEALDSGAPPHGGIAFGIDRIMSILCGTETIRDVIAFPKNSRGEDLMTNSPISIDSNILKEFHIKTNVSDK